MRKIKALALAAVMLVGISALPLQVNAACNEFIVICENGDFAWGDVCGGTYDQRVEAVEDFARDFC